MSSHHIVREKQEPALLILGLDNFSDEWLGQLLEWSPTVMVTAAVAEQLNAYGIKVDWVITDEPDADVQSDVKTLALNGQSVLAASFDFLVKSQYSAVNIITDEFDLNSFIAYWDQINIVIFNNGQKIYPITSGFHKWKPAGEVITLLSQADDLQTDGLELTGEKQLKTLQDGLISIRFAQPFLFIAEPL